MGSNTTTLFAIIITHLVLEKVVSYSFITISISKSLTAAIQASTLNKLPNCYHHLHYLRNNIIIIKGTAAAKPFCPLCFILNRLGMHFSNRILGNVTIIKISNTIIHTKFITNSSRDHYYVFVN